MSKRDLRRAVAVFTVLTFSVDNLGAANFLLAGPPPAALHLQALPRHPALLPIPPSRPQAAPRALPRAPLFSLPDTAKLLAPARRLLAWTRAAIDAFYAPLPQEAIDLAPAPVLTKPVAPASILPALREAITTSAGELPPAPRMGDTPIVFDEEAFFASAPAPAYLPPPAVSPVKRSAPRRLKLTSSFMKITETSERVAGFQTMRLHWDKSYAEGLVPASPYRTIQTSTWDNVKEVRQIGYEGSKPFGERTIYEATYHDGTKGVIRASPLVFDLAGRGVTTSPRVVLYDIKGAGRADKVKRINDIAEGTGALVFDADKDGAAGEGGQELFGDSTDLDGDGKADGWSDGFMALRGLVEKAVRDGVLSSHILAQGRLDAAALASLGKAYGLGMKVGGLNKPVVSLTKAGVTAVWFSTNRATRHGNFDGDGNDVSLQSGAVFTRADGSVGAYSDIWFAHK